VKKIRYHLGLGMTMRINFFSRDGYGILKLVPTPTPLPSLVACNLILKLASNVYFDYFLLDFDVFRLSSIKLILSILVHWSCFVLLSKNVHCLISSFDFIYLGMSRFHILHGNVLLTFLD